MHNSTTSSGIGLVARGRAALLVALTMLTVVAALALLPASQAAAQAPAPAGFTMTNFEPAKQSFRFVNSWSGDITVDLPVVGTVNFGTIKFGLCGGMVYAALDTYRTGSIAPQGVTPPRPGTDARSYIKSRQYHSLAAENAFALRRFLAWQWRPLDDKKALGVTLVKGLKTLSREQFTDLVRPRLTRGMPVPLGLVNVFGLSKPWRNHQVLAIGFRNRPDNEATIAVYDPNFPISPSNPDGITYLHTKTRAQSYDPEGKQVLTSSDGSVLQYRGFFSTPYSGRKPPWAP